MKNQKTLVLTLISILVVTSIYSIPVFAEPPAYDLTGTWTWNYHYNSGIYTHTMMITSFDMVTGDFSGTGYYNSNPAYTWIVTGNVDGNEVSFLIDYTGANPSYYVEAEGSIISGGFFMSGTATAPGQSATWTAEKEIPITLTFPPGSTAEAEIQILETLPPCTPDLPTALDIIPLISVKIVSGTFDGNVQVCIQYDDTGMTDMQEKNLRLFISNCVDFNLDGTINGIDISLIMQAIRNGDLDEKFDVNGDGTTNYADVLIVKEYATKGLIINWGQDGEEFQARLPWIDITTNVDIDNNIICGETSHFSIFRCR